MARQYEEIDDGDDASPKFPMIPTHRSAVEITAESKLRLIERENSTSLYKQKPEKCHLMSQKKYRDEKYNPNNVVFMSRNLHQQFDAIDSSEGIPMFYLEYYVKHDASPVQGIVNNWPVPVYPTVVNAVLFKDEDARSVLIQLLLQRAYRYFTYNNSV